MFKTNPPSQPRETYRPAFIPALPFPLADLPEPDEVRGLAPGLLEDNAIPEAELRQEMQERLWPLLATATLFSLGVHLVALLPFDWAFVGSILAGLLSAILYFYLAPQRRLLAFLARLCCPTLLIVPAHFLANTLLVQRASASFWLTLLALVLLYGLFTPAHPIRFWWDYLFCAMWLKPTTRLAQWNIILGQADARFKWLLKTIGRNLVFALAVLFVVVVTADHSSRRAVFFLLVIGLCFSDFCRPQVWKAFWRLMSHDLTYPGTPIPGNHIPRASLRQRWWFFGATLVTLQLALSTGLTVYFPAEIVHRPHVPSVTAPPVAASPSPSRLPDWRKKGGKHKPTPPALPSPPALPPTPAPNANTYDGMRKFFLATWEAKSITAQGLFDFLLFPLFCAAVLPLLLMLAALRGFVLDAERLEAHLATLDERDERSEWQWYVDRLQDEADESEEANEEE